MWLDEIALSHCELLSPATTSQIAELENVLGYVLPEDYKAFLLWASGGYLNDRSFILYSVSESPGFLETIRKANLENQSTTYPIVAVGRDAFDDFGFLKTDLAAGKSAVYFISHEIGELQYAADSFRQFIANIAI